MFNFYTAMVLEELLNGKEENPIEETSQHCLSKSVFIDSFDYNPKEENLALSTVEKFNN